MPDCLSFLILLQSRLAGVALRRYAQKATVCGISAADRGMAARLDGVYRGERGFYQIFMGDPLKGNCEARRISRTSACMDLRYVESGADAATVTTTMASAAKNSFAVQMALGGRGAKGRCAAPDGFCGAGRMGWSEIEVPARSYRFDGKPLDAWVNLI